MANSYFQFKQFRIEQGQTAMKVTTEACILGGWVADQGLKPEKILDIGAGTGLLTLMLAQRYDCEIDAVEIDPEAACQATRNFELSPWTSGIKLFEEDIRVFAGKTDKRYDLIISNPPFFANHLISKDDSRNNALHQYAMTQQDLLDAVDRLLSESGHFAVLYPVYESEQFAQMMSQRGLNPFKRLRIRDAVSKPDLRQITLFGRKVSTDVVDEQLMIKNPDGDYTPDFIELLQEYYLNL